MTTSAHDLPPGDWRLAVYGGTRIIGTDRRKQPSTADRQRILAAQGDICLYCQLPIGTIVTRNGRDVVLRRNWDHFVPYAYSARNPGTNWVLSCHVCNGIKSCRMFTTVKDAQDMILPIRKAKGYSMPLPNRPTQREAAPEMSGRQHRTAGDE
jgi:hypothetical protein